MDIRIQVWLLDIKVCIEEIFDFLGDRRDFIAYQNDKMKKKAIERNLEIIGEAMNRILKVDANFPLDNISDEVIWTIIVRELPLLKKQVDELITEE